MTDLLPDTTQLPKNGQPKQITLSSNKTLFWRIFVPIFGTVMLGVLTLAYVFTTDDQVYTPLMPTLWGKVVALLLLGFWLYFVWRALWRLHRVDADDTHLYITNYWTTVRYPWTDVTTLEEKRRLGQRVVLIHLRAPGRFGQKIAFLPGSVYDEWIREHRQPSSSAPLG